eukprot:Gregarina_sp_Poly_1__9460@NODE_593_length_7311_cov_152_329238_g458_i0_p3_GENE_NODE_593_length_7311_cov_152_329238_g458_i0NODE_593_length_7311_cov_152_329238_g458_i0_p3_ORF_typecomplete_len176_score31_97_NODE_593_length_7311_cov_152_329238_g458_i0103630
MRQNPEVDRALTPWNEARAETGEDEVESSSRLLAEAGDRSPLETPFIDENEEIAAIKAEDHPSFVYPNRPPTPILMPGVVTPSAGIPSPGSVPYWAPMPSPQIPDQHVMIQSHPYPCCCHHNCHSHFGGGSAAAAAAGPPGGGYVINNYGGHPQGAVPVEARAVAPTEPDPELEM